MIQVLNVIKEKMSELGVNYEFMEWTGDVVYPYFVGEYIEVPTSTEDGLQETEFLLTGFTRGTWHGLAMIQETIAHAFHDFRAITETGAGVAISYSDTSAIPTGELELKRIQINLNVKEWSVK